MLDPYQVTEARAWGADCILIILAMVDDEVGARPVLGRRATITAWTCWSKCMTKRNWTAPWRSAPTDRDQQPRSQDLRHRSATSRCKLAPKIPKDVLVVAESGLVHPGRSRRPGGSRRHHLPDRRKPDAPDGCRGRDAGADRRYTLIMSKLTHLDDDRRGAHGRCLRQGRHRARSDRRSDRHPLAGSLRGRDGRATRPKGDVLAAARIAGIMAAKKTADLIPLCHPLALSKADVDFEWLDERIAIRITALAKTTGQTGVEMEALTAASVAALTIYDMVKAIDKGDGDRSHSSGRASPAARAGATKRSRKSPPSAIRAEREAEDSDGRSRRAAPRPRCTARSLSRLHDISAACARPTGRRARAFPPAQIYAFLTGRSRGAQTGCRRTAGARGARARRRHVPVISVDEATARIVAAFSPVEQRNASQSAMRPAACWPKMPGADDPAAGAGVVHGRLRRARRRCRARLPQRCASSGRRRPVIRSAAAVDIRAKRFASSPAAWCPTAPTRSSSRKTPTADGDRVTVNAAARPERHIRVAGLDFKADQVLLRKPAGACPRAMFRCWPQAISPRSTVRRRPRIALAATGDELSPPGAPRSPGGIVASSGYGLAAMIENGAADAIDLGIFPDTMEAVASIADRAAEADLVVTLGGASVGDHDLVQRALGPRGFALDFWKIAMRPGKPLIFGRLGADAVARSARQSGFDIGLRDPVSATGHRGDAGNRDQNTPALGPIDWLPAPRTKRDRITCARGSLSATASIGRKHSPVQDSAMLSTLAAADALIVRPPHAPAENAGERVDVLPLLDLLRFVGEKRRHDEFPDPHFVR